MTAVRSALFALWLYGSMAFFAILCSPALLMSHAAAMTVVRWWARFVLFGLRWIVGARVEVRGLEHRPTGAALIAAKHQGMLDIVAPFTFLPDPCFVMKKELMALPFIGWFARKTGMIPVDRAAHAAALKEMVRQTRLRLSEGRQILIFPEGTRTAPGSPAGYKPGVAAIYRDLGETCTPMAVLTGLVWPASGFARRPGVAVFEFLEPVPAGLKRADFMRELESRIETRSTALLDATTPS